MVTIQFDIGTSTVNESDGSVTINLVRMGNHTDNITVCIGIIMIVDPAVVQCMNIAYRSLEKFTVEYFRVKFVCGKIFLSLGISNE